MFPCRALSATKNTEEKPPSSRWQVHLKSKLAGTRKRLTNALSHLFLGKKAVDARLLEEIETILISADIGLKTSDFIIQQLTDQMARKALSDPLALMRQLKQIMLEMLTPLAQPIMLSQMPYVILMVGVNGAGKTTTIAKMAHYFQQQQKRVLLAAGDTFRAAAVEQLKVWAERCDIPVIGQSERSDSASVIFDAFNAAKAQGYDLLIADTAGRLHTQAHLMQELKKVQRVLGKIDPNAPHEVMLVIDGSLGQNSLNQAKQFHQDIGLTSLSITKLDGSAKGGIVLAIAKELALPIRFIGLGEGINDLEPFSAKAFIEALWDTHEVN